MKIWKKFLVQRRDGTVPEWPYLVLGARDPAAPHAIRELGRESARLGMDREYCDDLMALASAFETYRQEHGDGDPDAGPHRQDDPKVVDILDQILASDPPR